MLLYPCFLSIPLLCLCNGRKWKHRWRRWQHGSWHKQQLLELRQRWRPHYCSGKVAISLTVKTLASGLSDKLQPGDIIRIYHFLDTAAEVPELRFVKVLSVTDSDGINVDNAKEPTEDEEKQQSATITVLASPEQAKIITGLENDGVAHVALISRNNDKLADELLAEQDKTLQEIYFPETLIEEEAADAENSDVESEPQETETAESAQSTNETAPSAE